MPEIALERPTQVAKRMNRCRATLHNDAREGLLTPPITIGARWTAWPTHEIDAILRARIAGWDKDQIRELVMELTAKRQTAAPGRIARRDDDEPAFVT